MTFKFTTFSGWREFRAQPDDAQWWFAQHDRYKWRFASTMPFAPHSYIWRDKEMTTDDYDRMFGAVRTFGTPGKYWDRTQLYLINPENGYRYWLMGRGIGCTILNMATDGKTYGVQDAPKTATDRWAEYDEIGCWWDEIYREFHEFDKVALWKVVHRNVELAKPSMLDLGAGTGGSLDARIAPSQNTTVVDPSQAMLNDLVLKYPKVGEVHPMTAAEYLAGASREHDIVVASLGSASYLTADEILKAHEQSRFLTVLSFYARVPSHRESLPMTHEVAREAALSLPGAVSMVHGNFEHVVARGHG